VADFSKEVGENAVAAVRDLYRWIGSEDGKAAIKSLGDALTAFGDAILWVANAMGTAQSKYNALPDFLKKLLGLNVLETIDPRVTGPGGSFWKPKDDGFIKDTDDAANFLRGSGGTTNITVNTTGATTERAIGIALRAERAALG
jgi:hypothetical protein